MVPILYLTLLHLPAEEAAGLMALCRLAAAVVVAQVLQQQTTQVLLALSTKEILAVTALPMRTQMWAAAAVVVRGR